MTARIRPRLIALLCLAAGADIACAVGTLPSPYRLSPTVSTATMTTMSPPHQRSAYQMDDRYRLAKPDDQRPYAAQIASAARQSGLDPELVHAVVAVESAYRPAAVSPKGAVGLMQVLPETAQSYGVHNPAEVSANLQAGTRHLRGLMDRFDNRLDLALAAYNAGEGAVKRHGNAIPPYAETRSYVPAVVAKYRAGGTRSSGKHAAGTSPVPATITYLAGTRLEAGASRQRH